MAKKVEYWEAEDGMRFETEEDAEVWESSIPIRWALQDLLIGISPLKRDEIVEVIIEHKDEIRRILGF
jgi:hypothetical protein